MGKCKKYEVLFSIFVLEISNNLTKFALFLFFRPFRFEEKGPFSTTLVYIVRYSMVPSKISKVNFLGIHVYIRNQ